MLTVSGDVRLAQLEANVFASPYLATAAESVSRAAESAEFTPVREAVLQRSAATLVVRGQRLERNAAGIVGINGTALLLRAQSNRLSVLMDGSAQLATAAGADLRTGRYAAACAFDATGRSVARNGVAVVIDSGTPPASRSSSCHGRDGADTVVACGDGGMTVSWSLERGLPTGACSTSHLFPNRSPHRAFMNAFRLRTVLSRIAMSSQIDQLSMYQWS